MNALISTHVEQAVILMQDLKYQIYLRLKDDDAKTSTIGLNLIALQVERAVTLTQGLIFALKW